jgi:uncharacterized protein YbjT (DUF2867 family)
MFCTLKSLSILAAHGLSGIAGMSVRSILVIGGSGFIGKGICRAAADRNFKVYSLSRSGGMRLSRQPWMDQVEWIKGSGLEVDSFEHILPEVSAIVHSVGILFEKPPETFELMNYRTAVSVIPCLSQYPNIKSFGFISAADIQPNLLINERYYSAKRKAEEEIMASAPNPFIMRPGRSD